MSLVDVLNHLEEVDTEMEKEASEMEKLAAEEEAAGRIMARGFMDELNKLAADMQFKGDAVGPKPLKPLKREAGLPPPAPLPQQSRTKGYKAPPAGKPYAGSGKAKMGPGVR